MILYGSIDNGFVSQALINKAFGKESIDGVLLNGLVLKAFHKPESNNKFLILIAVSSKEK